MSEKAQGYPVGAVASQQLMISKRSGCHSWISAWWRELKSPLCMIKWNIKGFRGSGHIPWINIRAQIAPSFFMAKMQLSGIIPEAAHQILQLVCIDAWFWAVKTQMGSMTTSRRTEWVSMWISSQWFIKWGSQMQTSWLWDSVGKYIVLAVIQILTYKLHHV